MRAGLAARSHRRGFYGVVPTALLTLAGAACVPAPAVTVQPVATGLDIPWDFAWAPNGALLLTERAQGLSILVGGEQRLVWRPADLLVESEAGMMGMVLSPAFATNREVFVCFASTASGSPDVRIGNPAPGNRGPPFDPRIQSYGHRNVQGLAFRTDGKAFAVEHGPRCDDEVNLLVAGANYGWDPVPRAPGDPAYNEDVPMTDLVRFPDAMPASWSSGCPAIATSGGTFVTGPAWQAWDGGLAMAALAGTQLRMVRLSADARSTLTTSTALTDRGRLRTPRVGPDGALT